MKASPQAKARQKLARLYKRLALEREREHEREMYEPKGWQELRLSDVAIALMDMRELARAKANAMK